MGVCKQISDERASWILLMAAIRSALVLIISQKNREVQYEKLTSFAANIYADIFFLQKSKRQLDEMTTRSFSIYQELPAESELRQRALSLANMGHEVMGATLIYGILGILDIANAGAYLLGAYVGYYVYQATGQLILAFLIAMVEITEGT